MAEAEVFSVVSSGDDEPTEALCNPGATCAARLMTLALPVGLPLSNTRCVKLHLCLLQVAGPAPCARSTTLLPSWLAQCAAQSGPTLVGAQSTGLLPTQRQWQQRLLKLRLARPQ